MLTISGKHDGTKIFCNVVLMPIPRLDGLGQNQSTPAPKLLVLRALIDTGATCTNITPSTAKKLDLEPLGLAEVATAGGTVYATYYLFKLGFLKDANNQSQMLIPQSPIEGLELLEEEQEFDVLLGMDVLSQGVFKMSSRRFEFSIGA